MGCGFSPCPPKSSENRQAAHETLQGEQGMGGKRMMQGASILEGPVMVQ